MPEEPTNGARVVTQVDINGRPANREAIRLPDELGTLGSDGAAYLISASAGGIYQHRPSGPRRLTTGQLLAVGGKHLLAWDCDQRARCNPYRIERGAHGRRTMLPVDHKPILELYQGNTDQAEDFGGGDLSPDGTHAALRIPGMQPDSSPIAVLDLTTGHTDTVPGSLTDSNANTQLAWTTNSRWLLAITDHQMRAYDTRTRTTRTITFTNEQLLHLTMIGATGN